MFSGLDVRKSELDLDKCIEQAERAIRLSDAMLERVKEVAHVIDERVFHVLENCQTPDPH